MVFAKKAKRFELMTAGDDHWADILTPSILVFSLSGFEQETFSLHLPIEPPEDRFKVKT